jgi:hypothetical protein
MLLLADVLALTRPEYQYAAGADGHSRLRRGQ